MKTTRRTVQKNRVTPRVKAGTGRQRQPSTDFFDIRTVMEQETVTLQDVWRVARAVGGSQAAAQGFMVRRFPRFGDRTPEEATNSGEGKKVVGVLLNIAGI